MSTHPRRRSAPRAIGGALLAVTGVLAPVVAAPAIPAAASAPAPGIYAPASGIVSQPAAPGAPEQLDRLGAEEAWQHTTGDGVTVAVVDSGVDADHPDLAGRVLPGRDFVASADGRVDPVGHGTMVASLIAGQGEAAVGLAPDATILPVRVLDDENRYQNAAIVAEGVTWAVEQGAQVINLSLGGTGFSPALSDAISLAIARDVVVVACTGNAGEDSGTGVWFPAREPGVLAVSGLAWPEQGGGPDGWSEALTGPETVLAAPAVVTGAAAGGDHRLAQGTSFSSALVAASAALLRARWPEMSAANVVNRLLATAEDLGPAGRDPTFGFGAVDPVAALTEPAPEVLTNPLDTKARHGTAGFGQAPSVASGPATPPVSGGDGALPTASGEPAAGEAADNPPARSGFRPPRGLVLALATAMVALLTAALVIRLVARPSI